MNYKNFIKVNPIRFFFFVLLAVFQPILSVVGTYLVQQETNSALSRNWQQFLVINILSLVVLGLNYTFSSIAQYLDEIQQQDLNQEVRAKIIKHYYFDQKDHPVSDVQNRLTNDLTLVDDGYFLGLFGLIYGIILIIGILVYLVALNWALLLANVLLVAVSLALPKLIEKPISRATNLISEKNEKYIDTLNEWLSGLDQLRQFMAGCKTVFSNSRCIQKIRRCDG